MDLQLAVICLLTFSINLIGALAYAARIAALPAPKNAVVRPVFPRSAGWPRREPLNRSRNTLVRAVRNVNRPARISPCCRIAFCGKPVPTFPRDALVLLRHKLPLLRSCLLALAQHGHLGSVRAIATASLRWMVVIELGTWRCGRIGGAAGSVTFG